MLKVLNALKKVCDRVCNRAGNSAGKRIDCLVRVMTDTFCLRIQNHQ